MRQYWTRPFQERWPWSSAWFITLTFNGHDTNFKIDTGAEVTAISLAWIVTSKRKGNWMSCNMINYKENCQDLATHNLYMYIYTHVSPIQYRPLYIYPQNLSANAKNYCMNKYRLQRYQLPLRLSMGRHDSNLGPSDSFQELYHTRERQQCKRYLLSVA